MRRLGYLAWGVFAILAMLFYPERAIFTDAAFQNFHMLQDESLFISHGRFGNVIPQLLPWVFMKLGASLNIILLAYSVSFILFFAGLYWVLVTLLKNDFLGWSLILYFCLLAYDSFFHVQSELYQGIAVLLLFFGIVLQQREARWSLIRWIFLIFFMVALAFYHKLVVLFFGFIWAYFWLHDPTIRRKQYLVLLPLMLIIVFGKDMLWQSAYEDNRMDILRQGLMDYFPNFWDMPANWKFLKKCLERFMLFPVFLSILVVWYSRKREFLKLTLILGASLGYLLLVHYSSPNTSFDFYSEVTYLPLGLLVGLPFVFDVLPRLESSFPDKVSLGFSLLLAFRIGFISYNGLNYHIRLSWIQTTTTDLAASAESCCVRMYSNQAPKELVQADWAIAYESLLITALRTPDQQATLFLEDDFLEVYPDLKTGEKFLAPFDQIPFGALNPHFFSLSANVYQLVE